VSLTPAARLLIPATMLSRDGFNAAYIPHLLANQTHQRDDDGAYGPRSARCLGAHYPHALTRLSDSALIRVQSCDGLRGGV